MGYSVKDLRRAKSPDHAVAITPSDTATFNPPLRGVYVGGAGAVKVDTVGGESAIVFSGLLAGSYLNLNITRVYAAGTTATNLVGLYDKPDGT